MSDISECERWSLVREYAIEIQAFIDFLASKKIYLARYSPSGEVMVRDCADSNSMIHEFYKIDPIKLDNERREILRRIQAGNN